MLTSRTTEIRSAVKCFTPVVVFPVITGVTGKERIFDGYPDLSLELVDARTFDGQIQLLEYIPTVLDGPPVADA